MVAAVQQGRYRGEQLFFWPTTPGIISLAPNASGSAQIQFQAGQDFEWWGNAMWADINGAAQTDSTRVIPNWTVQAILGGSQDQYMSGPVPIGTFFGDARSPFMLPRPVLIRQQTTITFNFASFEAANTVNLRPLLYGINKLT